MAHVPFSNRPAGVERFQTIHYGSVDVDHGLVLLFGIGTNVDSVFQQAVKAGGQTVMEPMDMFYGDRSGGVKDPSGDSWFIATHKEDVSAQELQKRAEAFVKQQKSRAA
jgi:uncharacterized glyoxalase superfamily protein PhnB